MQLLTWVEAVWSKVGHVWKQGKLGQPGHLQDDYDDCDHDDDDDYDDDTDDDDGPSDHHLKR